MSFVKRIIHEAIKPFVDSGPFGAGPSYSMRERKTLSRALFDLSERTWTPPAKLVRGPVADAVAQIVETFPVLAASSISARDEYFCERLIKAAERFMLTKDVSEPVWRCFGEAFRREFDRDTFLDQLRNSVLASVDASPSAKIEAANVFARADVGDITPTATQWAAICRAPMEFSYLEPAEFISALRQTESSVNQNQASFKR